MVYFFYVLERLLRCEMREDYGGGRTQHEKGRTEVRRTGEAATRKDAKIQDGCGEDRLAWFYDQKGIDDGASVFLGEAGLGDMN